MICLSKDKQQIKFDFTVLNRIICILCIIASIGCIIMLNISASTYKNTYDENNVKIHDLSAEIESLKCETVVSEESVSVAMHSAASAGNAVAKAQNQYGDLDIESSTYRDERTVVKNTITKYFSEEESGYASQWYFSPDVKYEWRFLSTYSFDSESMNVIWGCYDKDDNVLALCTGVYDVKTGFFTDCNAMETDYGLSLTTGGDETSVDMDKINDMIEQMR